MGDPLPAAGEILLYETEDGRTRVECRFQDETLWLTQALMAELFHVTVPTINKHLKAIFTEGEAIRDATVRNFRIVRFEGERQVSRAIEHYSLDAVLAAGYRVRSSRGTQFRRWATERLREYLVKGFVMDDERLKSPPAPGSGAPDYFDELLERNRIVTMWLDFAEDQARRRKQVFLNDWETRLDQFLRFNDRDVLENAGRVSKAEADTHAEGEYERFAERRRALLEADGARASFDALDEAARRLAPARGGSPTSPDRPPGEKDAEKAHRRSPAADE
jgi:hypothetical protein